MKFKVIDLLNAIAEGKELPEKFMYKGHLYYREKTKGICYRCDELNEIFEECLVLEDLNDTVEIIKEPKKIKKIEIYEDGEGHYFLNKQDRKVYVNCDEIDFMVDKFNELIDEINKLKEND